MTFGLIHSGKILRLCPSYRHSPIFVMPLLMYSLLKVGYVWMVGGGDTKENLTQYFSSCVGLAVVARGHWPTDKKIIILLTIRPLRLLAEPDCLIYMSAAWGGLRFFVMMSLCKASSQRGQTQRKRVLWGCNLQT